MENKITPLEIEVARRGLTRQKDFSEYRHVPPPPFFGGVRASRQLPAMVVADFALTNENGPTVLLYYNGIVAEHNLDHSFHWDVATIEANESWYARAIRAVGEKIGFRRMMAFGLYETVKTETLKWVSDTVDIHHNLEYLAILCTSVGVKKLGIVLDPHVDFGGIPPMLKGGVKIFGLVGLYDRFAREEALNRLAGILFKRQIGLVEGSEILKQVQAVPSLVVDGTDTLVAGPAHHMVETLAILAANLTENEFGQLTFGNE